MDIFKKLAQLADTLDQRGLTVEASEVDAVLQELVKSAANWPSEGPVSKYSPEEGTEIEGRKDNPAMQKHVQNLQALRQELGLNPNPNGPLFDKQVAMMLRKYYPGVWQPGQKQRSSDLLAAVKQRGPAKEMDFAGTNPWGKDDLQGLHQEMDGTGMAQTREEPVDPGRRGEPVGKMQSIQMPSTRPTSDVELPEKPETKLP